MGGALFGYLEGHDLGHNVLATMRGMPEKPPDVEISWIEILKNMVIGTGMGLSGGIALTCFGLAATHHIPITEDTLDRQRIKTGAEAMATRFKTYFKRKDVEEHVRSVQKMAEKHDKKRQEKEVEEKEILKIGTEGVKIKKFGKKKR